MQTKNLRKRINKILGLILAIVISSHGLQASNPQTVLQKNIAIKLIERRFKNSLTSKTNQEMVEVLQDYEVFKKQGNPDKIVNFSPLIDRKDCRSRTALHYFVYINDLPKVKTLLQFGSVSLNVCDSSKMTPLDLAFNRKQGVCTEMVCVLRDAGAITSEEKDVAHITKNLNNSKI